ncbi:MAG TPA: bifunctional metallophosphatase/5'-nucleotidase [Anaerolineae bacterium]|nr:bifunctional metallophosphatase/5'-nucleotidase [Anaerolineae bacterium]
MKKTVRMFLVLVIVSMLLLPSLVTAQEVYPAGISVLDDFNRANGGIGGNWSGNKSRYRVSNNQLLVRYNGSNTDIYWKEKFGADQEAFVTFVHVDNYAIENNLLLKAQSRRTWGDGVILASYDAVNDAVSVWTWKWPQGWKKYGDDIPVTFEDGDTFSARALGNGMVEVYRNGELLGTRDITAWPYYDKGGYIGLWFSGARDAVLDDFGGGTLIDPPYQLVDLQLLAFNDYHGHLERTTPGTLDGAPAGGAEFLSAKLSELRAGNEHSLTVAAGDLIGGSPAFSGLFHDEPSVESLNAMQLDVSSVGNHEFDEGVTELLRMQNGGCHPIDGCYFPAAPFAGANFKWLAANVVHETTGETPLPPYWVDEFDGVKIGFIGMTLEATDTLVAASGIQGWEFLDEADTANALVPMLKAQGVEAIVVLLHEGGSQTPPPGDVDACVGISGPIVAINDALDPEIDAIITGHTHLPYNCMLTDSDGQPRIVTSAYSFGRVVTEVDLVLDKRTQDVRRDLSTSTNHTVIQAALTPDPALTAVIAKWQPLFNAAGTTPVGTITADINRGGVNGSDRGVESPAGNLVADAQLWATSASGAQIAFMNPGGVRSDLRYLQSAGEGDGVVTYGEAFTFQPFGNTLVTYPMTGAQIISVLEQQCQPLGSSRPFLHLGVSNGFTYDLAKTIAGGNCTSVTVSNVKLNGVALNPVATYMVTVNNFLADGGDNFTTFGTVTAPRLDGGNDLLALVNYLGTFSPVAPPSINRVNELP